jgi:uncharacterized protein YeaC (DUF1315 family)
MQIDELIGNMTPDMYQAVKRAVEIGKWPDGKSVTDEQRALCMEAVLNYGIKFLKEEERVGYIDRGSKEEGEQCSDEPKETTIKWQ